MLTMSIVMVVLLFFILLAELTNNRKHRKWESELVDLICNMSESIRTLLDRKSPEPTINTTKDDNWRCGTTDCVCNKNGVCDCHNYTQPPTASVG